MFTRIYKWLAAQFRAVKFAANKAEGYRYAKHLLATGAAGAEEHIEDLMFARDDGYDVGAMQALYEHYNGE
jgi:hypothetical protein